VDNPEEVKMEPIIPKEPRVFQDMEATMTHMEVTTKVGKTLEGAEVLPEDIMILVVARTEDIMILVGEVVAIMIATREVEVTMIATKEDIIMSRAEGIMIEIKVVTTKVEIEANNNKVADGLVRVSQGNETRADMIGINHQLEELLYLMKEVESQRVVTLYISLGWAAM
jgi:hypothetical protein